MIWKICNQEVSYEILEVFLCFVIVVSPVLCVNMWSIKANDMAGIVRKCIKEAYELLANFHDIIEIKQTTTINLNTIRSIDSDAFAHG